MKDKEIELKALECEMHGMVAENLWRQGLGQSPAYNEVNFSILAEKMRALTEGDVPRNVLIEEVADILRENLSHSDLRGRLASFVERRSNGKICPNCFVKDAKVIGFPRSHCSKCGYIYC